MTTAKSEPATISCPKCHGDGFVINPKASGARMRGLRLKAGLTLKQTSRRMGISLSYLADLESGRKPCRPALQLMFLDALDPKGAAK